MNQEPEKKIECKHGCKKGNCGNCGLENENTQDNVWKQDLVIIHRNYEATVLLIERLLSAEREKHSPVRCADEYVLQGAREERERIAKKMDGMSEDYFKADHTLDLVDQKLKELDAWRESVQAILEK